MKLELGSGYAPTPGFVHLDLNPNAPEVDIVGAAYPLPSEVWVKRWTELRAVDVLEHLSYRDTDAVLAEWASVLAHGGRLYVQVPDALTIMQRTVRSPKAVLARADECGYTAWSPIEAAAYLLLGGHADGCNVKGGDDWRLNAHYALFSAESLRRGIEAAGMRVESIHTNGHPNLCCWAVKP